MSGKILPLVIQGTPISPGLAQGTIHTHHGLLGPVDVPVTIDQNNVKEEFSRLDAATAPPRLGAMIETPAAALAAREIVKHTDFLSFGTNDLTHYVFAADRVNAAVELLQGCLGCHIQIAAIDTR